MFKKIISFLSIFFLINFFFPIASLGFNKKNDGISFQMLSISALLILGCFLLIDLG